MTKKDFKLFSGLLFWYLIPSVYLLIRMNLVHINSVDVNVLGQMEWFDLIDEILVQSLIVPLYSLLKGNKSGGKCGICSRIFKIAGSIFINHVYQYIFYSAADFK